MAQAGVPLVVASAASLHRLYGKSLPLVLQSAAPGEEERSAVAGAGSFLGGLCACVTEEPSHIAHDSVRLQLLGARSGKPYIAQLHSSSVQSPQLRSIRSPPPEHDEKQAAESCSSRQWRAIMLSSPPPIAWQHAQVAIGETMVRDSKTNKSHARLVRAYWDTEKHPGKVLLSVLSCDGDACGQLHATARPTWRWQALTLSANFDTVECIQSSRVRTTEEQPGPLIESVMVLCHEEGSLLALVVGDTDQRSCVIILTANLQPLRHALWCNYDAPALADRKVSIADGTWLAGTRLLAVIDSYGALGLLDFSGRLVQVELSTLDGEPGAALPQVAYTTLQAMGQGEVHDAPQLPNPCFSVTSCLLPGASSGLSESWRRQQSRLSGSQAGAVSAGHGKLSMAAASALPMPPQLSDCKGLLAVCDGVSLVMLRYQVHPLPPLLLLDTLLPPSHGDTSPSGESLGPGAAAAAVAASPGTGAGIAGIAATWVPETPQTPAASGVGTTRGPALGEVGRGTPTSNQHQLPLLMLDTSGTAPGSPVVATPSAARGSALPSPAASPALLLTMPPSPLAATLASRQLFSPHSLLRQQAPAGVSEKACSWPVVHKAITTFGSGPSEEQRIHHAHPHEPALLRAPSQLCLFEPDPLRSSMASLAAHSVRSVTSRVSANGASHPMPVLSASSAGPTIYGTADSPGPWTREEGGKAGSAPLVVMEPEAYEQLQLGTVALLEGRPSVALAHFVQAHVFGFLPCLLVLLQHLQIMPCIALLRNFVTFVGTCCASPAPSSSATEPQQASNTQQQPGSGLSPQIIKSRCRMAMRSALAALLPGEAPDADGIDVTAGAFAHERDRTSAPCSTASAWGDHDSMAGAGPGAGAGVLAGRGSHPHSQHPQPNHQHSFSEYADHERLSAPARTSGASGRHASGAPWDSLDPGFISLVQQRSAGPEAGGARQVHGQQGAADALPGAGAGPGAGQGHIGRSNDGEATISDEVDALLTACKQQLAVGCRCLAFLSHRLHTHASMLQTVAQTQRSPSMSQSPLASPSYSRPSQHRSPLLPRGAPPGVAPVAATAGTPRPSLSSPIGGVSSRLGRISMQRHRGATGLEASVQALMVGLPMPVVWHRLPDDPHLAHTDATASPLSHAMRQSKGNHVSFADGHTPPRQPQAAQHSSSSPSPRSGVLCSLGLFHSALDVRRLLPDTGHPTSTYSGSTIPGQAGAGATSSSALLLPRGFATASQEHEQTAEVPLALLVEQPPAAPAWFLEPQLAAGLLLLAFACDASVEQQALEQAGGRQLGGKAQGTEEQGSDHAGLLMVLPRCESVSVKGTRGPATPPRRRGGAGPCSRLNWRLLHAYPPAAQGAALWKGLGDWRKAAVLAFTVHQMIQQRSAALGNGASAGAGTRPYSLAYVPSQRVSAGRRPSLSGVGAADGQYVTASCLTIGLSILKEQVARCHGMEVQEACITLHELVAIPRHVLGHQAPVYGLMLRKVCDKLADLLPKRLGITQLLPPQSSTPSLLLHFCHHDIRHQLRAQLAQAVAKVCGELQLAMGCSGAPMVMCDAVQQVLADPEVEACVKMLLRWQGCYDAGRMATSIQMACEGAPSSFLFPDTGSSSWEACKLINVLELTLSTAGLLPPSDLSSTMQQARKQLPQEGEEDWDAGHSSAQLHQQGVPPAPQPLPSPFGEGMSAAPRGSVQQMMAQMQMQQQQQQQGCEGQASARNLVQRQQQLIDLNDLALLVDFAQIAGTLLACIQPHVHVALPLFQRAHVGQPGHRRPSAHSGWLPEAAAAAAIAAAAAEASTGVGAQPHSDPAAVAAMDELAAAVADLLRQLAALDWAMVCRVNVASLLAQLQPAAGSGGGSQGAAKLVSLDGRRKSLGSALGTRSLSTTQMHEPSTLRASPSQLADVQAQLLAWTSALIDADRHHVDTEMQGAVHMVLSCVRDASSHPYVLTQVNTVETALRGRNLFNAKLAEQISRLKKPADAASVQRREPASSRLDLAQAALQQQQAGAAAAAALPTLKTAMSMPKSRLYSNGNAPSTASAAEAVAVAASAGGAGAWQSPDEAAEQLHAALVDALKAFAAAYRGGKTGGGAAAGSGDAGAPGLNYAAAVGGALGGASQGNGGTAHGPLNSAVSVPSRVLRHRSLLCCMLDTLVHQPSHFTGGEAVTDGLGRLLRQDLRDCFVHPLRRWPWHHSNDGIIPDPADAPGSSPVKPGGKVGSGNGAGGVGDARSSGVASSQRGSWMNAGLETQQELAALLDVSSWLQLPPARTQSVKVGPRLPPAAVPASTAAAAAAATGHSNVAEASEAQALHWHGPETAAGVEAGVGGASSHNHTTQLGAGMQQVHDAAGLAAAWPVASAAAVITGVAASGTAAAQQVSGAGSWMAAAARASSVPTPALPLVAGMGGGIGSSRDGVVSSARAGQSLDGRKIGRAAGLEDFWHDNVDAASSSGAAITAGSTIAAAQALTSVAGLARGGTADALTGSVWLADMAASLVEEQGRGAPSPSKAHAISRNLVRPLTVDVPYGPPSDSLPQLGVGAQAIQFVKVTVPAPIAVLQPAAATMPVQAGLTLQAGLPLPAAAGALPTASSEGLTTSLLQQQLRASSFAHSSGVGAYVSADDSWLHAHTSLADTVAATVATSDVPHGPAVLQASLDPFFGQAGEQAQGLTARLDGMHSARGSTGGGSGQPLGTRSASAAPYKGPLEAWTMDVLGQDPAYDSTEHVAAVATSPGAAPLAPAPATAMFAAPPAHSVSGTSLGPWLRADCDTSEGGATLPPDQGLAADAASDSVSEAASEALATVSARLRSVLSAAASVGRPPSGGGLDASHDGSVHEHPGTSQQPLVPAPATSAWSVNTAAATTHGAQLGGRHGPAAHAMPASASAPSSAALKGSPPHAGVSIASTSPLVSQFLRSGSSDAPASPPTKAATATSAASRTGSSGSSGGARPLSAMNQQHQQAKYTSLHGGQPARPATAGARGPESTRYAANGASGGTSAARAALKPPIAPQAVGAAGNSRSAAAPAATQAGHSSLLKPTASSAAKSAAASRTSGSANSHNPLFSRQFRS